MTRIADYLFLILVWGIFLLLFLKDCNKGTIVDVRYIPGDSIPYTVYKNKPVPYSVTKTDTIPLYDTIWMPGDTQFVIMPVDTLAILKDYFAQVVYKDTVKNDSSALIVLNETVTKNRIKMREVIFQNKRPIAIIEERKRAFVLGVGGTVNGIDVSFGYRYRTDALSLFYSGMGWGLRYQKEIGVKK
jgi:hypothetical protein